MISNITKEKKEFYINLLAEIVSKKSVLKDEYLVADVIKDFLNSINVSYDVHFLDEQRPNVIAKIGSGKKKLLLVCHMDVVEGSGVWEFDPFVLSEQNGKLIGRGVADNKGPLVSLLILIDSLKSENFDGELQILFASDEEKSGPNGLKYLLHEDLIHADFAIVADTPGEFNKIMVAERGSLNVGVIAKGKQVHSAYTHLDGDNPIDKMASFIVKLSSYELNHDPHKYLTPPSLSFVKINGGFANNVVPSVCEATINIRYVVNQSVDEILSELKDIAGDNFEFRVKSYTVPSEVNEDHESISLLRSVAQKHGFNPILTGLDSGTDCKKLVHAGIPAVGYCFPKEGVAHQVNEWIWEEDLFIYADLMKDFVIEFFK